MVESTQIFVLGCARSGTSITYYAVQDATNLPGPGESHVVPIFQRILHQFYLYRKEFEENHKGVLACQLNPADFRKHIIQYIRQFYATHYPQGAWIDKTPGAEAIFGAVLIKQAFPVAKIICTRRNGVEVVDSFRTKFSTSFEDACRAWATSMDALSSIRRHDIDILEIDQFDMANSPMSVASSLAKYLGIQNKTDEFRDFFESNRPDQLSSHNWREHLSIDQTHWSADEKALFRNLCGAQMAKFGYAL